MVTKAQAFTLKLKPKDRKIIEALAAKYAKGNLSGWFKFAALNFRPTKSQILKR